MKASESAREAAADLEAWERDDSKRARFLSGEFDDTFAVQAITQAEARGRIAGIREAAALATSIGEQYGEDETGWFECSETIANCITALIPGEPA